MANNKQLLYKDDARKAILKVNPASAYCIDNIKPVDAVEVVHGRWIETTSADKEYGILTTKYECSECACLTDNKSNYCPNCGAKMDLED